ncbi:hypothetical protein, partial [Salmonella enterica]|uniref:hypothetical protein n=1 Tax=Salmonella enterica TaxID=28901 RepID=UPI003FA7B841
ALCRGAEERRRRDHHLARQVSNRRSDFKPVFGEAPSAASGGRDSAWPETLNRTLAPFFLEI